MNAALSLAAAEAHRTGEIRFPAEIATDPEIVTAGGPCGPCEPEGGLADFNNKRRRIGDVVQAGETVATNEPCGLSQPEDSLADLNGEQRRIVDAVLAGENVFFTGAPGCGKSFLLNKLVAVLQTLYADACPGSVVACASTGTAATNVNGSTLHAFLGCRLGKLAEDWERVQVDKFATRRIRNAKVLLVDELSMVSGSFFDVASRVVSEIIGNDGPFGGLQLILCGDFLQLPPVNARTMAFKSEAWQKLNLREFVLRSNHRQEEDESFRNLLAKLRNGEVPAELLAMEAQPCTEPGNSNQDTLDADGLRKVYGVGFKLLEKMGYQVPAQGQRVFVNDMRQGPPRFPETLGLQDLEAQGVRGFASWPPPEPVLRLVCTNDETDPENEQRLQDLPGETVTCRAIDTAARMRDPAIQQVFRDLMVQRELKLKLGARVMLLRNLRLPSECKEKPGGGKQLPLVNGSTGTIVGFSLGNPIVEFFGGYRRLVEPMEFSGTVGSSGQYCRLQTPLRLAWAITVHKSQGLTLDRGVVELGKAFEPAQIYVALSRFRQLEDVQVTSLPPNGKVNVGNLRLQAVRFHADLDTRTRPVSDAQREEEGWGTRLKPAGHHAEFGYLTAGAAEWNGSRAVIDLC